MSYIPRSGLLPFFADCNLQKVQARTVSDKVRENDRVMTQIANNSREQAMLSDFLQALDNAVLDSGEAHQKQQLRVLTALDAKKSFAAIIYDLLRSANKKHFREQPNCRSFLVLGVLSGAD